MSETYADGSVCGFFVIRIWIERSEGAESWRASALNTLTNKKTFFGSPEELTTFLRAQGPSAKPSR